MKVTVEMTTKELEDFLAYQKSQEEYRAKQMAALQQIKGLPFALATSLAYAVEPVEGKPGRFKIIDQEHMSDAWNCAGQIIEEVDG